MASGACATIDRLPITLITGPANSGKARAILDEVRRHVAHRERPLLVLPTGADADRYRRELAEDGPVVGVTVCLFAGLLERVARRAAVEEGALAAAPLSAGARMQMLSTLAAELAPGEGAGRRLAGALSGAIADLQAADVGPARLRAALREAIDDGELRARLLTELYERYSRCLGRHRLIDAELRARRALDVLRRSPRLWSVGGRPTPVLLYGFDDLTALELDAVETLGDSVGAPLTISLTYEAGRAAFAGRSATFQELLPHATEHVQLEARSDCYAPSSQPALHRLERCLFEADGAEMPAQLSLIEGPPAIAKRSAHVPTDGIRLTRCSSLQEEVELIAAEAAALIEGGMAPGEIAIVHRRPSAVADAFADALEAAGVPHAIAFSSSLADTALGRALIGLLACGCEGLAGCDSASLGDLLGWLRAPGHLQRIDLADSLEERALRSGVHDALRARRLWEREHWRLDGIDRVREAAERSIEALLEQSERELIRLFCAPRTAAAAVLDPSQEDAAALRAARTTIAQLQQLAAASSELVGGPAGVIEALRESRLSCARPAGISAVALLDPLSLRARRVRALFACGLQEGVFPAVGRPDPVFSEEMRARVSALCGPRLARREDPLASERYLLYATVSRPEEKLFLSWHMTGEDGAGSSPSLFLDDVRDVFGGGLLERRPETDEPAARAVTGIRGEDATVTATTACRAMAAGTMTVSYDPARIDRLADERLLEELRARRLWSASSLESWTACPVRWFVERLLHAESLDPEPEPIARGALAHAVLRDVLEELRQRTGSARITAATLSLAETLMQEALDRHEHERPLSVAPERAPAARRRLEADLRRYLRHAAEQQSPLEPMHLELSFGLEDHAEALPALELAPDVLLRGRIDRVDVGAGGEAVVYDYKSGRTGSGHSGFRWATSGHFQMALYMRAVQELTELQPVGGLYQPLSGPDLRARGVLAGDAGIELSCVRTDACGSDQLVEIVAVASDAAVQAAYEAQAGEIEPRPQTCGHGRGCMYPTICRCRR